MPKDSAYQRAAVLVHVSQPGRPHPVSTIETALSGVDVPAVLRRLEKDGFVRQYRQGDETFAEGLEPAVRWLPAQAAVITALQNIKKLSDEGPVTLDAMPWSKKLRYLLEQLDADGYITWLPKTGSPEHQKVAITREGHKYLNLCWP
jgi:ribosomal protein S8